MSETNCSTGGFRRITRLDPPVKMRLFGFVAVVVGGTLLLTWMTRTTWNQLDRLQKEHAAVKSEGFYLGVTLRSAVRNLNGLLLQFGLSQDPAVRETFVKESTSLKELFETNRTQLLEVADLRLLRRVGLSLDLELLQRAQKGFEEYLARTARILESGPPPADLDTFEEVYAQVQQASRKLLATCDEFVAVQRAGFSEFLAETQRTLTNHQLLLKLTSGSILGLAGMLAVFVYRGMIAPLRLGLTQSRTIIERQEKLASLGVLASGVAHEIRNPLTAIKFRLFSLKKALPALAENEDAVIIGNEINRLERIVRDFLRFARPSEPEAVPLPAATLLQEVQDLLKTQLAREAIELQVAAMEEVWVQADAQQMKQVLINLVQNAAEAIGHQGQIRLALRRATAELDGSVRPVAILSVTDNGKGISPEVEARLFDPFFTTKEGGTGLGLAIAARIVEKHGGMLRYESKLKQGTTFEVVLPRIESHAIETAPDRG